MEPNRLYVSYNDVHKMCREQAKEILARFRPDVIIAIGGGGFIPARILRTFLKMPGQKNIPIQAIGLSLYEELVSDAPEEVPGVEVKRTQWLDFSTLGMVDLVGKNVLIVDEVDDTRTTLHYAVRELRRDVEAQAKKLNRETEQTRFGIFVVHNKLKPKNAELSKDLLDSYYFVGQNTPDCWIMYPWEAVDIDDHDKHVAAQAEKK
ncbi:xanthine phosphoribosyltransferase [Schizosaccharomyces japonicus yFS275]|uniref:Xanthine phosphoribosyltransferase n=1 Tax=Schizosaccharomyces japonicus (strain yFS275 / FY16936) TaxID=402676 RepID=T0S307_SCHJY|nr:xanthine phosphoribosyltransferase [Schizosaccharomyces japonicus yFS275]EQC52996.1 xanthine phosphoribosyltransferase [Schizosaccharomyces japonicus yFS275]